MRSTVTFKVFFGRTSRVLLDANLSVDSRNVCVVGTVGVVVTVAVGIGELPGSI